MQVNNISRDILHNSSNVEWRRAFNGKLFKCIRCGRCCRDTYRKRRILLTERDANDIKAATGLEEKSFMKKRNAAHNAYFKYIMTMRNGACIFLKNNRCTIYRSRPLICRSYPIWITREKDGVMMTHVDEECPGVNLDEGVALDGKYISRILKKTEKTFAESSALARPAGDDNE